MYCNDMEPKIVEIRPHARSQRFFLVDRDFPIITRRTVNINFLATCEFATAFSMPQLDPPMTDATRSGEVRAGDRRGAQWRGGRRQPAKKSWPQAV